MRRYGQIIQLNPEKEQEYIRHHAAVWPGVLKTIADCHIKNYSIFLRNGLLFAYFEYHGSDYKTDMRRMEACVETQRWWRIIDPMQSSMADADLMEKWSEMSEVFHFDGFGEASQSSEQASLLLLAEEAPSMKLL